MATTTLSDLSQDAEDFYVEAHEDCVGLWQIVSRTARDGEAARERALSLVRMILTRGLRAGNLTENGAFAPWPQQEPDLVVGRIRREWIALGHDPTINDIAWFALPSS
jgi:hypothetical protein